MIGGTRYRLGIIQTFIFNNQVYLLVVCLVGYFLLDVHTCIHTSAVAKLRFFLVGHIRGQIWFPRVAYEDA